MWSARQVVREAAGRLARAGVPEPGASAEILLVELLGMRRSELLLRKEPLTAEETTLYETCISRRLVREPVQRILGYAYFRDLKLDLDEHTLIPRPDTEGVVDAVLGAVDARGGACRVLDLGTGSGAIAIAVAQERPRCEVHASDSSEGALRVARRNAVLAGTAACFHAADLASGLDHLAGSVEVLVSNPPYIRTGDLPSLAPEVRDWEPHAALDGGPGGLDFYHRIFAEVPPLLAEGAEIMLEVGDGQNEAVLELGGRAGFEPLGARTDLAGCPRVVVLRWRPQG